MRRPMCLGATVILSAKNRIYSKSKLAVFQRQRSFHLYVAKAIKGDYSKAPPRLLAHIRPIHVEDVVSRCNSGVGCL